MNIEDLSIFGLYSQKENKVTAALLQVLGFGGASLLRSFISSFAYFFILPIIWRNRQTLWGGCADANPKLSTNDT